MEGLKIFHLLAFFSTFSVILVNGQISTPCTTSMISTFTPCINFVTGSSANGAATTPTQDCCGSFKSLMDNSVDCACLVLTANVPLPLPINPTLSLSLPRACKMGGVAIQCKATATPLPAPGPAILGPARAPIGTSPLSPRASKDSTLAPAPSDTTLLAPSPKIRPVLTPPPSVSHPSYVSPPAILLLFVGIMIFNIY